MYKYTETSLRDGRRPPKQSRDCFGASRFAMTVISIAALCCLTGCTVSSEKKEEVLDKDPSFKHILNKKNTTNSEIADLKMELKNKRNIANAKIGTLKKEFRKEKQKINSEIKRLKAQLNSERSLVKDEKKLLSRDINEKESKLTNTEKTITDLENLIAKEGTLDISQAEVTRWQQRIKVLEGEKKKIRNELKTLRSELGILDAKIKLLR